MKTWAWLIITALFILSLAGCGASRKKAQEHYLQGALFERECKTREAIEEYRSAITIIPDFIPAHAAYQRLMVQIGQKNSIVDYYEVLRRDNPGNPTFCYLYGILQDTPGERMDACKKALTLDPNFVWAFNTIGLEYLDRGEVDEAIKQFKHVIEIDSEFAPVHLNLSRAYVKKDKWNAAYSEIKKYLELEPDSPEGFEQLGFVYIEKGDHKNAIEAWKKALALSPGNPAITVQIARALSRVKKYDDALAMLDSARKISPANGTLHYERGLIYLAQEDFEKSGEELKKALKSDPGNSEVLESLGIVQMKSGNLREARNILEKAKKQSPQMSIKGLLALGELNEQEGNSAEAQKAYQEALKREPENVQARRSLALLHTRKRELKKAIGNYEILFKNRDEVTSGDCLELALLCWETGNEKKAQEYLSRAISLEPDSPDCLLKIILMGEMRNKEKSAARLLQKISKEVISREVASEYLAASLIERLKYNEAAETLQSSSGKIPERSLSCYCYGMARMGEKKYAEALSAFKKARSLAREKDLLIKGLIYCSMGHIHAEKGNFKTGLAQLTAASTAAGEFLFPAKVDYETARLYALKGESSKALIFLRKSIRAGFNNSMLLKKDPSFDKLRKNSEFIRLSGMIHAPQEQN